MAAVRLTWSVSDTHNYSSTDVFTLHLHLHLHLHLLLDSLHPAYMLHQMVY